MPDFEAIYYSGLTLDRASELRKDTVWIGQQWNRSNCKVLLLKDDQNLMHWQRDAGLAPVSISHNRDEIKNLGLDPSAVVFLGLDEDNPLFAADVAAYEDTVFDSIIGDNEFIDLRQAGWFLSAQEAALLAYARGLLYWNRHSGFCSTCGSATEIQHGGHLKLCTNVQCARMTFPRTDPAVIMLVEHRPESGPSRCLLARNARFPSRMMSTLAGFVDPSESLEETVEREVYEESGIQVTNVTYQASQPWPFPSSIMLGFHALALTTEIRIDSIEIEEAGWFSAEQLGNFGEWGDAGDGYCLPRKDSIARYLIETWMADVTRRP